VVRALLRKAVLTDLYVLARLLGYDSPEWRWDAMHLWIVHSLIPSWRLKPGGQFALFAPRGTAKTAIEEVEIVQEILRNPNVSIGVGSWELEVSIKITRAVKLHLEKDILLWLFPETVPSPRERQNGAVKWTEDNLMVLRRGRASSDMTLTAFSLKSPAVAKHFDILYLDDVVEDQNSSTEDSIINVKERMRDIRSLRRDKHSRIELRGTLWDPEDFYCTEVIGNKQWSVTAIPALVPLPNSLNKWQPPIPIDGTDDEWLVPGYSCRPTFPSSKPLEILKEDLGSNLQHFSGQMLLDMRETRDSRWPEPCLHFDESALEPPYSSFQFVDLAGNRPEGKGDDSVVMLVHTFWATPHEWHIWIWDIFAGRLGWGDLACKIFDNYEEWKAPAIIEEVGAYSEFETALNNEWQRRHEAARSKLIALHKDPDAAISPMVPHTTIKARKGGSDSAGVKSRIEVIGPFFGVRDKGLVVPGTCRIFSKDPASCKDEFQRKCFLMYEHQKTRYPNIKKDDILDCLADAVVFGQPTSRQQSYQAGAAAHGVRSVRARV
jgi:hypothetical protein